MRVQILLLIGCLAAAQTAPPDRILGVVTAITGSSVQIKTDAGDVREAVLAAEVRVEKIAPGERDLKNAQQITAAELAAGDRVLARGTLKNAVLEARSIVVISQTDLAQKQEKERVEWQTRGVSGLVTSVNAAAHEIQIRIPQLMGKASTMVIAVPEAAKLRRYAPDSVRFADAKPAALEAIQPGDQLRAKGEKAADGTRIDAEEIVTGAFRLAAGTVALVDPEKNELTLTERGTGHTLTVRVTPESTLRRMSDTPVMTGMPGGGPPAGMQGPPAGPPDFQKMLEHMPRTAMADLKAGETILVASTKGADPQRVTAITLLANVAPLLAMQEAMASQSQGAPAASAEPGGTWTLGASPMLTMQ